MNFHFSQSSGSGGKPRAARVFKSIFQGKIEEANRHLIVNLENVAGRRAVVERLPQRFVSTATAVY
jgi:hypothetical protein